MGSTLKEGMFRDGSAIHVWLEDAKSKSENGSSNAKETQVRKLDIELSEIVQIAEQAEIVQIAEQSTVADEGTTLSMTDLNRKTKQPFLSS